MNENKSITQYFRDSLAVNPILPFAKKKYEVISDQEFSNGTIEWEKSNKEDKEVIIIAKTLQTPFHVQKVVQSETEELTGLFYIPAKLLKTGQLLPPDKKTPWVARDFLHPNINGDFAVGDVNEMDKFLSENYARVMNDHQLTWEMYLDYSKQLYEAVVHTEFQETQVGRFHLEPHLYMIDDDRIDASFQIRTLYENLLKKKEHPKLYENLIRTTPEDNKPLLLNSLGNMNLHTGQMGGEYPLSESQREGVNHFTNMEEGEILAVNGPPGTGKTTLIQSLIAHLFVERALNEEDPPLIVASSTNNQAVTNIIESLQGAKETGSALMDRWVGNVIRDFATYFPSNVKKNDKEFQVTNVKGEQFFAQIENEQYKKDAETQFIKMSNEYFQQNIDSVEEAKRAIHNLLTNRDKYRQEVLSLFQEFENKFEDSKDIFEKTKEIEEYIETIQNEYVHMQERMNEWESFYRELPLFWKWLSFIPGIKRKITQSMLRHRNLKETFITEESTLEDIMHVYTDLLSRHMKEKQKLTEQLKFMEGMKEKCSLLEELIEESPHMNIEKARENMKSVQTVNELLDTTIRYHMFWLAVHYFEAEWLLSRPLSSKQKGLTYKNVIQHRYRQLSMISPCFVMTFYQLPKNFKAYEKKESIFLYEAIDLLIVDEAGQVTPEVAAASFSLAKKAVVVGDIHQIEPVWNITEALDQSLVKSAFKLENKATAKEGYHLVSGAGLNVSQSSVMKMAGKSTKYEKHGQKGLFLSEHRRCYNDIISYCNDLVYNGKLEPLRGTREEDDKNQLPLAVPPMGHVQVTTSCSEKRNGSRYNKREAKHIVEWLEKNFHLVRDSYDSKIPDNMLIGVITPFKQQEIEVKKQLKRSTEIAAENIVVGTVHKFQGGERQVILLSTVYGNSERASFINMNPSMMNVAVSRAKDVFIVLGDRGCLGDNRSTPTGLLNETVKVINEENQKTITVNN
ncbi:AAA domain-containing protein [Halobacillus litoralis]|uniref:AAA domain-containing protein n=1 Tax=Halobacillus litoralis TaxID=45668 RepID=UPI0024911EF9|nr:AAA domain-containing protein [Halobacillus litoralis]